MANRRQVKIRSGLRRSQGTSRRRVDAVDGAHCDDGRRALTLPGATGSFNELGLVPVTATVTPATASRPVPATARRSPVTAMDLVMRRLLLAAFPGIINVPGVV